MVNSWEVQNTSNINTYMLNEFVETPNISEFDSYARNFSLDDLNSTKCKKFQLTKYEYGVAFFTNITLIIVALVPSYVIILSKIHHVMNRRSLEKLGNMLFPRAISRHKKIHFLCLIITLILGTILSPLLLFISFIILKCGHQIAEKKRKAKERLDVGSKSVEND